MNAASLALAGADDAARTGAVREEDNREPALGPKPPLRHQAPRLLLGLCVLSLAGLFIVDLLTPHGYADWILYLLPLLGTLWLPQPRIPIIVAAACTVLLVIGYVASPPGGIPLEVAVTNRAVGTLLLWSTALLIQQRRRAEERITDALNYIHTLLDAAPVGIITYTASGELASANEVAARMVGATRDQLKAQNFHRLRSWQESGLIDAAEAALATGHEQRVETRHVSSFGKSLWLHGCFVPFQFEGHTQLLATFLDFSERRRAEESLRRHAGANSAFGASQKNLWISFRS